ncbi:hypothetical protein NH62_22386 [Vibrio cholerae]|nr:hypothetical protein NH62_22386 [Vibrio cholerae]
MIYSMTAYARKEVKGDWGSAVWEIRSVNQRYLETYFRLPEQFPWFRATAARAFSSAPVTR